MTLPCASVLLASCFICSRRRREASKIDDGGDELLDDGEAFNIIMMVAVVEGKFSISWLSSIVMENEMNLVLLFGGPRGRLLLKLLQLEWL